MGLAGCSKFTNTENIKILDIFCFLADLGITLKQIFNILTGHRPSLELSKIEIS